MEGMGVNIVSEFLIVFQSLGCSSFVSSSVLLVESVRKPVRNQSLYCECIYAIEVQYSETCLERLLQSETTHLKHVERAQLYCTIKLELCLNTVQVSL